MSKDIALTADDGFPSDFTHKRVSESKRSPGKILGYKHLLLGWLGPKSAYMVKMVADHGKDVINWGYQVNFKLMDILTPQGALAGEILTLGADIALFAALKDYADNQSVINGTDPKTEYAKLLAIMAMPFGMVILIGMAVYSISAKDWGTVYDDLRKEPLLKPFIYIVETIMPYEDSWKVVKDWQQYPLEEEP